MTFDGNNAESGAAISTNAHSSNATIRNSQFENNRADDYAGAFYALRGSISITGSSFVKNRAAAVGGAIYMGGRRLTISNSTFSENYAGGFGGAIDMISGDVVLTHVTMFRNRTGSAGGHAIARNGGRLSLRNSLIVGFGQGDCEGGLNESRGNFSADGTCGAKPDDNALLEDLSGSPGYHALKDRSPAIGAADPAFCLDTDQLGAARPQVGGCDIGAIEMPPIVARVADCLVTTTHALNFRAGPAGNRIGLIPEGAALTATARTPAWIQVEYRGAAGWISADFVVEQGDCA